MNIKTENKLDGVLSLRINKQVSDELKQLSDTVGLSRNALINNLLLWAVAAGRVPSPDSPKFKRLLKQIGFSNGKKRE